MSQRFMTVNGNEAAASLAHRCNEVMTSGVTDGLVN
jgi:hypothetical protein